MSKVYEIREIFQSLQGEGHRAGSSNVFLRFAHCDLRCSFCDTDFSSSASMRLADIIDAVKKFSARSIILTGGEPTLQVDSAMIAALKESGFYIAIETNGLHKVIDGIDYVAVSPKTAEHTILNGVGKTRSEVSELRYPRRHLDPLPQPAVLAKQYFLSPIVTDSHSETIANVDWCRHLVENNSGPWRLSLQMHKVWGVQ